MKKRCDWVGNNDLYIEYHDNEWGKPVKNDSKQFEFLILETFQSGLSWITVLKKRENFRKAFDNFDFLRIANYGEDKVNELLANSGIIRNKLKIRATISNAQAFIKIQDEYGSFTNYIWSYVNHQPIINKWKSVEDIPAKTELSDKIAMDLKKRGFKFIGSTVMYAHLQASGIVNDHSIDCFCHPDNL